MMRSVKQPIGGWGNYPVEECELYRPERSRELADLLRSNGSQTFIPRGLGRSYGDAALNAGHGVILNERFDRFVSFDPQTGTVECEVSVSFDEIIKTFLQRGYFLPVTPGTRFVTVGGAIAADVHGKNHHRNGSIAEYVEDFRLLLADGSSILCSRHENAEAFWATLGGMGLTGVIQTARIRLLPVETGYIAVRHERTKNLDETLRQFSEHDAGYQYSVAWIDCLASGDSLGRGVLIRGNQAKASELPAPLSRQPLAPPLKRNKAVPFNMPGFVVNPLSIKAFNAFYYGTHKDAGEHLEDYATFFYPLDSVLHWNRMYGKRGFVQFQVVLPYSTSHKGLVELLEQLSGSGRPSFLAVLKTFGPQNPGLLSFPFEGHTLALDLPYTGQDLVDFLTKLNELVLKYEGRVYLAKDAVLKPEHVRVMYPRLEEFRTVRSRLDPKGLFTSSLARRVGLVDAHG